MVVQHRLRHLEPAFAQVEPSSFIVVPRSVSARMQHSLLPSSGLRRSFICRIHSAEVDRLRQLRRLLGPSRVLALAPVSSGHLLRLASPLVVPRCRGLGEVFTANLSDDLLVVLHCPEIKQCLLLHHSLLLHRRSSRWHLRTALLWLEVRFEVGQTLVSSLVARLLLLEVPLSSDPFL